MKKILIALMFLVVGLGTSHAQFGKLLDKAKSTISGDSNPTDIGSGLKEALNIGVGDAVKSLSSTNGYLESSYKILMPDEVQKVTSKLSKLPGFGNVETELINKMNEAAEIAAKKATPIFLDAIKQMSFEDASKILLGESDAATNYLEGTSRDALSSEFMPVIQKSLEEVNATSYWENAVTTYNKLPFTKDLNPRLDDHVNQKALDGMFGLIKEKELGIRSNKLLRTSPLLEKVFARQDK